MAAAASADLGLTTERNSLKNRSDPPHVMPFNVPPGSDNANIPGSAPAAAGAAGVTGAAGAAAAAAASTTGAAGSTGVQGQSSAQRLKNRKEEPSLGD